MRILFFGTPELAVPSLASVAERHEVAAVVCPPDKPVGRSKKPIAPAVKSWALEHGIPVHQPTKLNDGAFEAWLRGQQPEACAIAAYGRLLKQPILDVPPHGFINMHPSLLPRWRGPSPIQSAVLAGDMVTGVSIMKLTLEMDAGPILLQEKTVIGDDETAAELTERLSVLGGQMLADALDQVAEGAAAYRPQDEDAAVFCRMLSKEDGHIDWSRPAHELHDLVRGCQPWPVAQCIYGGETCKIHRSELWDEPHEAAPGTVTYIDKDCVYVAAGEGCLGIRVFQAPGKKAMAMADFLRGNPIKTGDRFESKV